MLAIADAVEYRKGETHVHTIGSEALEQGAGVCQDHAHIFCAVCRALDVRARYVSGYLSHGAGHEAHPQATPGPRPSWIISDGSASILLTARVPPMPIFAPRSGSITLRQAQYEG
jgi:transglutaminase superfamily protein